VICVTLNDEEESEIEDIELDFEFDIGESIPTIKKEIETPSFIKKLST